MSFFGTELHAMRHGHDAETVGGKLVAAGAVSTSMTAPFRRPGSGGDFLLNHFR